MFFNWRLFFKAERLALFHQPFSLRRWAYVLFFSVLFLLFLAKLLWKAAVLRRPRAKLFTHAYMVIATGVVVQRVLYLYMTRSTLDVFNCSPSNPPDYDSKGNVVYYMAFNAAIVCYQPGGVHLFLLPFAFFAMALYVAGLIRRAGALEPPTQPDFDAVMHTNVLGAKDLMLVRAPRPSAVASAASAASAVPVSLDALEREHLQKALAQSNGNVTQAARQLGISRDTLRYRMERHGLQK